MKKSTSKITAATLALLSLAACMDVPEDDTPAPVSGVIRGTVLYQGAHPCTQDGHVVGAVIVLVFDQNNPPPPAGIATTPVNFGVVTGDQLFANEPRQTQPGVRTCAAGTTTASAPFAISPFAAGTYVVQAFYDSTGNFLPTFKIRDLPEKGDVGGGYLDTADAQLHASDPNYQPIYYPVTIGVPQSGADAGALTLPPQGFVADNIPVTLGETLPLTRPYFHPDKAEVTPASSVTAANPNGDPLHVPIVTMTQDQQVLAPPSVLSLSAGQAFQASFTSVQLDWGVAANEETAALDPLQPFHMQSPTFDQGGGLLVWQAGGLIPEGQIQALYPLAVFAKLVDDPTHTIDLQSTTAQGSATQPIVIIQGITLANDSVVDSVGTAFSATTPADPKARVDHLTTLIRPSVICFDPAHIDQGGLLVTPHLTGIAADDSGAKAQVPLFDPKALLAAQPKLIRDYTEACLPTGRYQINLVYPSGQAWTVPDEAGSCASDEGAVGPASTAAGAPPGDGLQSCQNKPRAVMPSQGTRAVLEIVPPPPGDNYCTGAHAVPAACLSN